MYLTVFFYQTCGLGLSLGLGSCSWRFDESGSPGYIDSTNNFWGLIYGAGFCSFQLIIIIRALAGRRQLFLIHKQATQLMKLKSTSLQRDPQVHSRCVERTPTQAPTRRRKLTVVSLETKTRRSSLITPPKPSFLQRILFCGTSSVSTTVMEKGEEDRTYQQIIYLNRMTEPPSSPCPGYFNMRKARSFQLPQALIIAAPGRQEAISQPETPINKLKLLENELDGEMIF